MSGDVIDLMQRLSSGSRKPRPRLGGAPNGNGNEDIERMLRLGHEIDLIQDEQTRWNLMEVWRKEAFRLSGKRIFGEYQ